MYATCRHLADALLDIQQVLDVCILRLVKILMGAEEVRWMELQYGVWVNKEAGSAAVLWMVEPSWASVSFQIEKNTKTCCPKSPVLPVSIVVANTVSWVRWV